MTIIEKVIDMCEDAEVLRPEGSSKIVLAPIKPAGRIHADFGEGREMYIAFTDKMSDLFCGNFYLGAIMIDRYGNGYAVRHFFILGDTIALNGGDVGELVAPVISDTRLTDLIWNTGNHDKIPRVVFEYNYRGLKDSNPGVFEDCWARTSQLHFSIMINARGDGLTF